MTLKQFQEIIKILRDEYKKWDAPAKRLSQSYRYKRTPFTILISTVLSFRTKDEVTFDAAHRLFAIADNPYDMLNVSRETIEQAIYPVGFYREKAKSIHTISKELIEKFGGNVPNTLEALTSIKGVGPKTAKIVLENAFGKSYVAVDTHVHRICNRWGLVHTKNPQETDKILEKILKEEDKKGLNKVLVSFGQILCKPQKPNCEECPVKETLKDFGIICTDP
ncbi:MULTISPECIES: endonuclease III [unclassified Nitratiruptor]|uniref:endonuclease III domain-containing protein n=1 Tax=unclassified Nitratiruptor TaxID=2624044 RepID=UPI0019153762|nr:MULTISPECIES: endonuclease III [unclassified Nitratiruptor]BCD59324.1 endonuclease III [Nitratiruptor sp. YY08-10]BCD63248.1 endonuclease III [Nitratiruptor sp. YY08-14]